MRSKGQDTDRRSEGPDTNTQTSTMWAPDAPPLTPDELVAALRAQARRYQILLANCGRGNDERWGETKHGAMGHTERPLVPHRPALRRLPCPCSHKRSVPSLSRQPVSPRPPSPVGPWRCTCATRWGCSIKIRTSRRCSPLGDNRRTGSVKSQAERVLGTRKRRAVVGRERRCCRKAAISVVPVRRMRVSTRLRQAAMIWGAGPLRR